MYFKTFIGLAVVCLIGFAGCGNPHDHKMTGVVKIDGVPVQFGRMVFTPVYEPGTEVLYRAYGNIREGKFHTTGEGELTPGLNMLLVSVHDYPPNTVIRMSDIASFETYWVDIEIPDGGKEDMVIEIDSANAKYKHDRWEEKEAGLEAEPEAAEATESQSAENESGSVDSSIAAE